MEADQVRRVLKAGLMGLAGSVLWAVAAAAGPAIAAQQADSPQRAVAGAVSAASQPKRSPYAPDRFAGRAGLFYSTIWGVDSLSVKLVESGQLVRFSYRVVDPDKARSLNEPTSAARLDDPQAGVSLAVPTMEKVGPLRQTMAAQAGRSYWMTFSNKGRLVKRGDRVDVVIGMFKASNVVVD